MLEAPKPRLKAIQRRILREVLEPIGLHDAAHGFRRGHSAGGHAAVHTGQRVVLRLDLADFFASVRAAQVYGILRLAGYPEAVAHLLTGLTTNAVPVDTWAAVPRPTASARYTRYADDLAVSSGRTSTGASRTRFARPSTTLQSTGRTRGDKLRARFARIDWS